MAVPAIVAAPASASVPPVDAVVHFPNAQELAADFVRSPHVISACEECYERTGKLPPLQTTNGRMHCPACGKYRWLALHGETAYDPALIRA
jgi:hypothetical protein